MPVYNEIDTLEKIVERVRAVGIAEEIIIVDDGSVDGTRDILNQIEEFPEIRIIMHEQNQGKGAAVVTGMRAAQGDVLIIQDADLEYDPQDYARLLEPIEDGQTDVVYGSRFALGDNRRPLFLNWIANKLLTLTTNILYGATLTDMETCYKVFRRELVTDMTIHARRFDFEPEFTSKLLKRKIKILEIPISFNPRNYGEGKKITPWDGVVALWTLIKYRFVD